MGKGLEVRKEALRQIVIKKFGSMHRFCNLAEIPYHTIQNAIRPHTKDPEKIRRLEMLAAGMPDGLTRQEITHEQRLEIRAAILDKYKNIAAFCRAGDWDQSHVDKILNESSRSIRKVTPAIKRLCKQLNIEL